MKGLYKKPCDMSAGWCHVYPNARLPNVTGGYDEDPEIFSNSFDYAKDGILNFVGGLLRHLPLAHQGRLRQCEGVPRPTASAAAQVPLLLGLEPCNLTKEAFQWVGERSNLMGSDKFKKLVDACKWDEATEVCIALCEKKADILDFNLDSDLTDGQSAMSKFMRLCATEPTVARLPFMMDSSKWPVVERGLKCVQGKCIVNSISLNVCEEEFLRQAKLCMRYRAAVVIMAFDEKGQAATFEDKVRICQCSYRVLRDVLTIATVFPEHNSYGIDFVNAVEEIKCWISKGLQTCGEHCRCPTGYQYRSSFLLDRGVSC